MRVLIAVIAYNESSNIERTLQDLIDFRGSASSFDYDIVVIDNGSSDDTPDLARKMGIPVVSHCINSGGSGGTVATYFFYADYHNYDVLAQFDGDGQHIASELPNIIQPILDEQADYVVGSRYIKKDGFQSTGLRRIGIRLFNFLIERLTGVVITDSTSGARAYSKKVIRFFSRSYRHEIYDPIQLLLLSYYTGAQIKEVPITMREREGGKSEFTFYYSLVFMIKGTVNILASFLQRSRLRALAG